MSAFAKWLSRVRSANTPPADTCLPARTDLQKWKTYQSQVAQTVNTKQQTVDKCDPRAAQARITASALTNECDVASIQLNTASNDLARLQQTVDNCDPRAALERRITEERNRAQQWTNQNTANYNAAKQNFARAITTANKLSEAATELQTYNLELQNELDELTAKKDDYDQLARRERRRFLDNDPQSGVGGIPGVRTSDDKILLAFWINYGIAIAVVVFAALHFYGARVGVTGWKSQVQIILLALFVAYALAYYGIVTFA